MFKTSVPIKVAIGYTIVIVIFSIAAWMVYDNSQAFIRINQTERTFMQRRNIIDSLVYSFMQMSDRERAISLGETDEWTEFDRSLQHTILLSEHLQTSLTDSIQKTKVDSLQLLLQLKRNCTLQLMRIMVENSSNHFLEHKVSSLHKGEDSVMIHPKMADVKENKETIYEVVKSRKGFFARLADVFRRQHADTVNVIYNHQQSNDSTHQAVDITHDVANVLADIKHQDDQLKRKRLNKIEQRERQQQLLGIKVANQTEQLLRDIRQDEYQAKLKAFDQDVKTRQGIVAKIILLAVVSFLSSIILLGFVWRDVKRQQRDRQRLQRAKEESERLMNQRERLLLTITHDIKAPAASISGFIQLLQEKVADPHAQSYISNIANSADHLLHLVTALLDYHQLEDGRISLHPTTFCPHQLVSSCADSVRPQAENKGLQVLCDLSACSRSFYQGDAYRIKQVVDNLVSNAFKYTDQGHISIQASTTANSLQVHVSDTGCGMTEAETHRIFNAFARLPEFQGKEGVGLGLSIVQELVQLLQGKIQVSSKKGKGSSFLVTFPVTPVQGLQEETQKMAPSAKRVESILLLDDDSLQLTLLQEMLSQLGVGIGSVKVCQRVDKALETFHQTTPSAMFIDIEMPEMNGMEVARRIGKHPGTRLIAMTAHDASILPQLAEAGFDDCLFKPFTVGKLADTLGISSPMPTIQTSSVSKGTYDFSSLTAFASGDQEAEQEILHSFAQELQGYIQALDSALSTGDRQSVAHVAHKALPVMTMIKAKKLPLLLRMSPEHINELSNEQLRQATQQVMEEMALIKRQCL